MRKLKLLALAGFSLIWWTAPAYADPITSAIAALATALGASAATAAAIAQFVLGTLLSVGLNLIASALSSSPKQQTVDQQFGIKTSLQSGGTVPRSIIIGRYMTPGSEYYPARTWGEDGKTQNAYFSRFIALSDLPSEGLAGIIVDDKLCTYGSGTPDANLGYAIPEFNKDGKDHIWVKFHDGSQTTADTYFVSLFAGDPDYPYGADMIGKGVSYVIVTALIEPSLFSNIPNYKFILDGAKFYDPRKDSSVGGSGAHRFDDYSTWEFTKNPAVVKYNILRGVSFGGQWLYGLQNTAAGRLPLDNWFAAMNVCDNAIEYKTGVSRAQFECGGEIPLNSQPVDTLDQLNKADNGRLIENGGIFKTRSGPVGAAVMSFTDADLITTEGQSFDPFPGLETVINGVDATYPEPGSNWAMVPAPSLYDSDLEAADGGRRLIASIQYNVVPDGDQVQFLMKSAREEGRKFRKHTVIAPPRAAQLDGLDVIAWTSARNGYSAKLFTAIPTDQNNLDQALVLVEVDPADYDWDSATDYQSYTPIAIVGQPVPSQVMTGFDVAPATLPGANGREVAAIRLIWGTSGIYAVDGVEFQVRDTSSPPVLVLSGERTDFANGAGYISENIDAATDYEVRARYHPINGAQESEWSDWLAVTTPDVKIVTDELADALITFGKFAAGITPVQQVNALADAVVGNGNLAVITDTGAADYGKLYRYSSDTSPPGWALATASSFSDLTGTIAADQFSTTIRPIEVVSSLPATGNFDGRCVFLTTDKKVYRYDADASPPGYTAEVDGADVKANSISAGQIQAGAIGTDQLSAHAVTASKLFIGDATNLIADITCTDLAAWSTIRDNIDYGGTIQLDTGAWKYGTAVKAPLTNGSYAVIDSARAACSPGEEFYAAAQAYVSSGAAGAGDAYILFHDNSGHLVDYQSIGPVANDGTIHNISGSATCPSGASWVSIGFNSTNTGPTGQIIALAAPVLRRKADAVTISDGAITADKLDANAVTAGKIAAGAINATSMIVSDLIVTGHLVANAVTDTISSSTGSQAMGTFPTPTYVVGGSGSITFGSANQPVFFTMTASASTAGRQRSVTVELWRNGSLIAAASTVPLTGTGYISMVGFDASNSAGLNNYEMRVNEDDPTGSGVPGTCNSATLFVAYWKR